jgi:hypothetical protein
MSPIPVTGVDYIKSSPAMNYSPIPNTQSPATISTVVPQGQGPATISNVVPSSLPFDESKVEGYNLADPNSIEYSYFLPEESPQLISSPMATASAMAYSPMSPSMNKSSMMPPAPIVATSMNQSLMMPPRPTVPTSMPPAPIATPSMPPAPIAATSMNQSSMMPPRPAAPIASTSMPLRPAAPIASTSMPPRPAAPIASTSMPPPPFALPTQLGNTVRNISENLLNPSSVI